MPQRGRYWSCVGCGVRREIRTAKLKPRRLPRSKKRRIRKKWHKRPENFPQWVWYDPDTVHCWRCGVDFDVESLMECQLTDNKPLELGFNLNRNNDPDIDPDRKLREKLKRLALSSTEG